MTEKQFELKVLKFIKDMSLFQSENRLLVAVSGGADSLCLLTLLSKWANPKQWKIKVAYFDHGLRKEAKKEKLFVRSWAKKLGFSFVSGKGNSLRKKKEGFSTEEAARKLRYDFLYKEAQKFECAKIILAHHLDDQVETFFVQLIRGCGLGGLSGMKVKDGNIIRPLLCVTKTEILKYLKKKSVSFIEDETNQSLIYLRNKVRHKLLPFLKRHFPEWNITKTLPKMMSVFKDEHEFLNVFSTEWCLQNLGKKRGEYEIMVNIFKQLPLAIQRRIIKNTLEPFSKMRNFTSSHIEEIRKLFFNPISYKKLLLPEGIIAQKYKKAVFFSQTL